MTKQTRRLTALAVMMMIFLACIASVAQGIMTETQKRRILAIANNARSNTAVPAANMKILRWDDRIAIAMQNYTDDCWRTNRAKDPPTYFLLNDHSPDPVRVATTRMVGMEKLFDLETGGCYNTTKPGIKKCRHPEVYGRVIQAGIERIGCGMTNGCPPGANGVRNVISCAIGRYDDTNVIHPFIPGPRCSQCPTGWNFCIRGLCSKEPGTNTPTQSPVTKQPTTRRPTRPIITKAPTTRRPTAPTITKAPTTRRPTPPTPNPTTKKPTTLRPTQSPVTKKPTTRRPTRNPTTKTPTSKRPTPSPTFTKKPTTRRPTPRK